MTYLEMRNRVFSVNYSEFWARVSVVVLGFAHKVQMMLLLIDMIYLDSYTYCKCLIIQHIFLHIYVVL